MSWPDRSTPKLGAPIRAWLLGLHQAAERFSQDVPGYAGGGPQLHGHVPWTGVTGSHVVSSKLALGQGKILSASGCLEPSLVLATHLQHTRA